jgi:hypothetical protein
MSKELRINISREGEVKVEATGYAGEECCSVGEALTRMGTVVEQHRSDDSYKQVLIENNYNYAN